MQKFYIKKGLFSSLLIFGCGTNQSQSSMMSEEQEWYRQKLTNEQSINNQGKGDYYKNLNWESDEEIRSGCYLLEKSNFSQIF